MPKGMKFDKGLKQQLLDDAAKMLEADTEMKPDALAETLHKKYAKEMLLSTGTKPNKNDFTSGTVKNWLRTLKKGKAHPKEVDKDTMPKQGDQVEALLKVLEQTEGKLINELASEVSQLEQMQSRIEEKVAKVAKKLQLTEDKVRELIRDI